MRGNKVSTHFTVYNSIEIKTKYYNQKIVQL